MRLQIGRRIFGRRYITLYLLNEAGEIQSWSQFAPRGDGMAEVVMPDGVEPIRTTIGEDPEDRRVGSRRKRAGT